jgi:ferredoxin
MRSYTKAIIYYFTGTGNALNVASWFKNVADERNIECTLVNIAEIDSYPIEAPPENALVVIVSPVHGFNYPPIMLSFISHFPKGKSDIILMNTRAGARIGKIVTPGLSGIAFYMAALFLKLKGYFINGMFPVDMPSNWLSFHPAFGKKTVLFLHEKMKTKVTKYANKILDGKKGYYALREIIQDIAISPVSLGYYFIGRFILAKTFYASASCDNCGICIAKCPVKAIILVNQRPFWKLTCESCMRCMCSCPKRSIETAHGFIIVVAFLFQWGIIRSLSHFFPDIIASINPFLYNWVIQFILFLGLMVIFYRIMHFMMRFRWFNKLMVYTSLTYYRFWGKRYKALKGF